MKSFPSKKDLKDCRLIDVSTQEVLIKFDAQTVSGRYVNAGYVGSGINSGGQAMTIATQEKFNYRPYAHQVQIMRNTYIVIAVRLEPLLKQGMAFTKTENSYILELQ